MSAVLENEGIDVEQVSDDLAADLTQGLGGEPRDDSLDTSIDNAAEAAEQRARDEAGKFTKKPDPVADPAAPVVDDLPAPKSWAKETHPLWEKAARGEALTKEEARSLLTTFNTREAQMAEGAKAYGTDAEYGRSLRGVIGQHEEFLRSQGLDAPRAVGYLMNAHRQLSAGTPEQKRAYLGKVAETYGITLDAAPVDPNAPAPAALPPEVKAALDRVARIEETLSSEQTQRYNAEKERIGAEVNAFASDPKNLYFEECADHICVLMKGDPSMKLGAAYETAVWANPVTRAKELARIQQETDKANQARAAEAARLAKKGTSTNVKGRDTARSPQAPAAKLDNLDDVMRETHEEIRSRT